MARGATTLSAFQKAALRSRTLPELNGLFNSFVRAFGFTAYAVGFAPGQDGCDEPFLLIDWPRPWLELYAREGFATEDAVVAAAATATQPFTWAELQRRQPGASARIFAAALSFGWADGLLVPVQLPSGSEKPRLGVASLAAPTLEAMDATGRAIVSEGSALALTRAVDLTSARMAADLTDRERQSLTLVATGRGDREIAAILQISPATAHFHVEQAKRKLGAITRAQAVALAVTQGLLGES